MRFVSNVKELCTPNGEPYTLIEPEKDKTGKFVFEDACEHCGKGEQPKTKNVTPSLAQWIEYTLNNVPWVKCTMKDAAHAGVIFRTLAQNNGTMAFEEADYTWLTEMLFSDEKGKALFPGDQRGEGKVEGALVLRWGLVRAAAIKEAVEAKADPEAETVAGPIPMNRGARRRAGVK